MEPDLLKQDLVIDDEFDTKRMIDSLREAQLPSKHEFIKGNINRLYTNQTTNITKELDDNKKRKVTVGKYKDNDDYKRMLKDGFSTADVEKMHESIIESQQNVIDQQAILIDGVTVGYSKYAKAFNIDRFHESSSEFIKRFKEVDVERFKIFKELFEMTKQMIFENNKETSRRNQESLDNNTSAMVAVADLIGGFSVKRPKITMPEDLPMMSSSLPQSGLKKPDLPPVDKAVFPDLPPVDNDNGMLSVDDEMAEFDGLSGEEEGNNGRKKK